MLQELDGDPVQPGPGVLVRRVEPAAFVKGDAERLGRQVLARVAGARAAERVQGGPIAVEELLEGVGVAP
jgi:hypothetical protein